MDIAWAHILQSNLNAKNDIKSTDIKSTDIKSTDIKSMNNKIIITNNCSKCGQQPYFCQCSSINDIVMKNFNFEQNNY